MRELKFRVYHPELSKLVYWRLEDGFDYSDRYLTQYEYPIQQFTGLKDKNGREIYEGDLIQYKRNSSYDNHVFEVKWSEDNLGWILQSKSGDVLINEWTPEGNRFNFIEIVGNVFENLS